MLFIYNCTNYMRFDKFVLSTEYVSQKRLKITCYFLVVQYDPLKTSGHRWINLRWRRLNIQSNVSVWVTAQKPLKKLDFKTDRKTATNRYSLCGLLWTRTGFSLGEHSRCINCISSVSASQLSALSFPVSEKPWPRCDFCLWEFEQKLQC